MSREVYLKIGDEVELSSEFMRHHSCKNNYRVEVIALTTIYKPESFLSKELLTGFVIRKALWYGDIKVWTVINQQTEDTEIIL